MNYRVSRLCSVGVDHAYFAGTDTEFIHWEPAPESVGSLAGQRLRFRTVPNGFELYFEADPSQASLSRPFLDIAPALSLRFLARAIHEAFSGGTDPLPSPALPFVFANRTGVADGAVGRLHLTPTAVDSNRARLVPRRATLRYATAAPSVLAIDGADGSRILERSLSPVEGHVETTFDFSAPGPGPFQVLLDGVPRERVYADDTLLHDPPAAILQLVMRPSGDGFGVLGGDGLPLTGGRPMRIAFAARSTTWRYLVVPRSDPAIGEADLAIVDTGPSGHVFTSEPKSTLPNGLQAVVFQSTATIPFRAMPYRGLALRRRAGEGPSLVEAVGDLPNPRPGVLSLASADNQPISEVYVYL